MRTLSKTNTIDYTLLIVRLFLGIIMAAHGAQKLLGWFGGHGFEATMSYFVQNGLPYMLSLALILAESIGMIALIAGLFSRILSGIVILIMLGAIITTHAKYGFFMNWFGVQLGEGFEFHLLIIALSSVLLLNGSGEYSLDKFLLKKFHNPGKLKLI